MESMDIETDNNRAGPMQLKPLFIEEDVDEQIGFISSQIYTNRVLMEDKFKTFCPGAKYLKYRRVLVDW